jgi:hypothetical protein
VLSNANQRRNGYAPDLAAIFHGMDRRLVSLMEVDEVCDCEASDRACLSQKILC